MIGLASGSARKAAVLASLRHFGTHAPNSFADGVCLPCICYRLLSDAPPALSGPYFLASLGARDRHATGCCLHRTEQNCALCQGQRHQGRGHWYHLAASPRPHMSLDGQSEVYGFGVWGFGFRSI